MNIERIERFVTFFEESDVWSIEIISWFGFFKLKIIESRIKTKKR